MCARIGDADGGGDGESRPESEVAPGTFTPRAGPAAAGPTDPGDAAVRVRVGRTDEGFYVADDGSGIDPEQRDAVFEPGHTTAPDGTGFGLAIVERIAEAHEWTVSVTEGREGGARFEFGCGDSIEPATASGSGTDPNSPRLSRGGNR